MKLSLTITVILIISALAGLTTSWFIYQYSFIPPNIEPDRTFHYPAAFVTSLKGDPKAGEKIFHEFCSACHGTDPIIPVNAPHIHHPADWKRFKFLTFDTLFQMVAQGTGAMPARGGCFECSDEQLKQAIHYLLHHR